jgi:hypothetical protein
MLKFRCKNCDQKIGVPDDWRGHVVRCPRCKQGVDVPSNAELINKPLPPARASTQPRVAPIPAPAPTSSSAPVASSPQVEQAPVPISVVIKATEAAPPPRIEEFFPTPILAVPAAPVIVAPPPALKPEAIVVPELPGLEISPPEPERPAPVNVPPAPEVFAPAQVIPEKPASAQVKPSKKPQKKSKADSKPVEPTVPVAPQAIAAQVAQPELPLATAPAPAEPEIPVTPTPLDPSVVVVTVARRDEASVSPLADPDTGNMVNLAEALTQSVVTPKPIVTSALTSAFASVFSSGAEPETIPPMIDVEQAPPAIPVAVTPVEPVSVSSQPETIFTSVTMDAAAPFAGSEPRSEPFAAAVGFDRELSDIVDVLPSEEVSSSESSAATDLLDTLGRTNRETFAPDGPVDVHFDPLGTPVKSSPAVAAQPRQTNPGALGVALFAMLVAAASLALCVSHSHAQLSLPVGVVGLLLAVLATVLAQGRSGIATITGVGAAIASMIAITIGVLIGLGRLPGSAAYAREQLANHLPAARAGDVEVRVRSASVLQPVLLRQKRLGQTAETARQSVLRVEVELRNVSDHGTAQYTSWAIASSRAEPIWLRDDEGNSLKPLSASGAVPPGRTPAETITLKPKDKPIGDVLLFEAPPTQARELDLQLPGDNVGSLEPLQLHIPAEMFARQ